MQLSKIGSANTYTRCLKQLDEWGYIQYLPSYNPTKGSLVNLYTFDNRSDKGSETVVRPSINSRNYTNSKTTKTKRVKTAFSPPPLDEVKEFFQEIESTSDQAEQFYNHFESNGWLVGGKAKMKDWKAAARNWVKRSTRFHQVPVERSRDGARNLNAPSNTNYSTPL